MTLVQSAVRPARTLPWPKMSARRVRGEPRGSGRTAHCRINLLYGDLSRAELVRHEWKAISGQVFDPWADVITVGLLDGNHHKHRPPDARDDIGVVLDRALTDIGAWPPCPRTRMRRSDRVDPPSVVADLS